MTLVMFCMIEYDTHYVLYYTVCKYIERCNKCQTEAEARNQTFCTTITQEPNFLHYNHKVYLLDYLELITVNQYFTGNVCLNMHTFPRHYRSFVQDEWKVPLHFVRAAQVSTHDSRCTGSPDPTCTIRES